MACIYWVQTYMAVFYEIFLLWSLKNNYTKGSGSCHFGCCRFCFPLISVAPGPFEGTEWKHCYKTLPRPKQQMKRLCLGRRVKMEVVKKQRWRQHPSSYAALDAPWSHLLNLCFPSASGGCWHAPAAMCCPSWGVKQFSSSWWHGFVSATRKRAGVRRNGGEW